MLKNPNFKLGCSKSEEQNLEQILIVKDKNESPFIYIYI